MILEVFSIWNDFIILFYDSNIYFHKYIWICLPLS